MSEILKPEKCNMKYLKGNEKYRRNIFSKWDEIEHSFLNKAKPSKGLINFPRL